ncbi:MAG: hypothetical protein GX491_11705 [Chloroflexi bacterium]|nr:hypothetical protein [Chloroflexota bacterium]
MPAAELSRLRTQINGLILRFNEPEAFHAALRDLLDLYSDRAYRPGKAVHSHPLLPTYRVPPLVLRQLEIELSKTCQEQPEQALAVVKILWRDDHIEPRLLAAHLLGAVPGSHDEAVLEILREWAKPNEDFRMLKELFKRGTAGLRRTAPQKVLALIESWMDTPRPEVQALGLQAMIPLIEDQSFENLPPIFRLISPLVQTPTQKLLTDIYAIMDALIKRSPTETAYFLRQTLAITSGPGTARLIRRCLPTFSPELQAGLRTALKAANPS